MTVRVKICGVQQVATARGAVAAGATAIGLMCYQPSRRYVTPTQAAAISAQLPPFVARVGVVVNPTAAEVQQLLAAVPLDYLQFHGDETAAFCASFDKPYIKAVRVQPTTDLMAVEQQYAQAAAILLDAYSPHDYGGTGGQFAWQQANYGGRQPIILAGGLTPQNVAAAIRATRPYAVDVSSGVETDGEKESAKIAEFCHAVQQATAAMQTFA